ncbi:hypothetical protein, partial [Acinetobacter baumannii]|uniref:hypothetical protein n=1 Tax=Acinetobacter baumannii TaxID=470 RepID=UPI0033920FC6
LLFVIDLFSDIEKFYIILNLWYQITTPPMPVPSPDEKGGGLGVGLATPIRKNKFTIKTLSTSSQRHVPYGESLQSAPTA